jgi:hypothetical protein
MRRVVVGQPTLTRPQLPQFGPFPWCYPLPPLLLLAAVVLATMALAGGEEHDSASSGLTSGYTGPTVVADVDGPRTAALDGVCEVIVRDVSGSVTSDIDPSAQLDREISTVMTALANEATADDIGTAIVFADTPEHTGPLPLDNSHLVTQLMNRPNGGGTVFTPALETARDALAACTPGTTQHVTLIADGVTSEAGDDVTSALAALPSNVRMDIIALGGSDSWNQVAAAWVRANTTVHIIDDLQAGVVAEIVATIVTNLTGHHVDITFET